MCLPARFLLWVPGVDCVTVGVLKRKELSEFIVSVIKGTADLTPRKKVVVAMPVDDQVVLDTRSEPGAQESQDSEAPEDTPVVHDEL